MRRDSGFAGGGGSVATVPSPEVLGSWLEEMAGFDPGLLGEGEALETITALEKVRRAAAALQARLAVRVDQTARQRQHREGVEASRLGAGVGAQIALARMESPHRGGRHLGLAKALAFELPQTLAGMVRGEVSEWQATIVARETACLDPDLRRRIDAAVGDRLAGWGERRTEREVRARAQEADPGAAVTRHAQATGERRVTLRPAPDTMCYLTALLPAVHGVAAYAALVRAADQARAHGEERGKGQVMADTMVERLTGQSTAADVPVEVELVMPLDTLLGQSHAPAFLAGYGPLPAATSRRLVRDTKAAAWLRRLFTSPDTGQLVAMDSRRRCFDHQLRHFVVLRDQFCRTPWCDAPIRHVDHPQPHSQGGPTDHLNAQGLCEACNYAKQAPGWHTQGAEAPEGPAITTTPTGRRYTSRSP